MQYRTPTSLNKSLVPDKEPPFKLRWEMQFQDGPPDQPDITD